MTDFYKPPMTSDPYPISLHHLTALDASAIELVTYAGAYGCPHVCLFTHVPEVARNVYPRVTRADVPALRREMTTSGVTLCNLEVFPLDRQIDWAAFDEGLATGAALGVTRATVHIHDFADMSEAAGRFGAFCDRAAAFGIAAGLEFNAFSGVKDIHSASAIVRAAARPNGSLVCDMLHLVRTGGSVADMGEAADSIGYFQICDGPLDRSEAEWWHEAVRERALPGAGAFPIRDALRTLYPGAIVDIEVPQTAARKAGVPPRNRIRSAVDATRRSLHAAFAGERA